MSGHSEIADGRVVVTRCDPWPSGVLTGYEDAGGFVVEHVAAYRPGVLLPMLRDGLALGRERGYEHIRLRLPRGWPPTPRLESLAVRMGFRLYHEEEEWLDYVTYLGRADGD